MLSDEELWKRARKSAQDKVGFYVHFAVFAAVNAMFVAIWWFTSVATGGAVAFPWFIFPLFGWGIGIAAHYVAAFHGEAYVERKSLEEFQRMRSRGLGSAEPIHG